MYSEYSGKDVHIGVVLLFTCILNIVVKMCTLVMYMSWQCAQYTSSGVSYSVSSSGVYHVVVYHDRNFIRK